MLGYLIGCGLVALAALVVGASLWALVDYMLAPRKLDAARKEYEALYIAHGYAAKEMCSHRIVQFSQAGTPDVFVATTKWCKVCGKDLGPATLVKSIFGDGWE